MSNKYIIDDALNYLSTANNFNRRVNGKAVVENVPPYNTLTLEEVVDLLNSLSEENEHLKKQLKRCKDWINSDKYDYELTLSFIKNKGYSLKDVL